MNNLKIIKILNIVFVIITVCMALTFLKFIGASSSEEYFKSFSTYIEKEGINEIYYDKKNKSLEIKKKNIKVIVKKEFNLINQIYIKKDVLYFEKDNDLLTLWINDFTYGSKLKEDLSVIKVIANKIEEVEINNKAQIESYLTKFYPYYVEFCDFEYKISLFNKELKCPFENNVKLKINTVDKDYELVIDNYADWSLIFKNYINFSDEKVTEEINKFNETAKYYNGKDYIENSGIISIIDKNNILYSNGMIKKTKKDITTEILVIKKDNKEYIEDLKEETKSYLKYKDMNSLDEDLKYIIDNLIN